MRAATTKAALWSLAIALLASAAAAFSAPTASADLDVTAFDSELLRQDGTAEVRAGAHPDRITTTFQLASHPDSLFGVLIPDEDLKDVVVDLPPGLLGAPTAVPSCPEGLLNTDDCPDSSQVGLFDVSLPFQNGYQPVYNIEPPAGVPARFGFQTGAGVIYLDAELRSDGDFGITVRSDGAATAGILGSKVTFWGVPADPSHDEVRGFEAFGRNCYAESQDNPEAPCSNTAGIPRRPFLTLPTDCSGGPPRTTLRAASWQSPGAFDELSVLTHHPGDPSSTYSLTDCENLAFDPSIAVHPTTTQADSPTGLNVRLRIPQNEDPDGRATAQLEDATVTLPEGMTINPSAAAGLGACSPSQIGLVERAPAKPRFSLGEDSCPDGSKLGTVEVDTPLLEEPLQGEIFQATQDDNAFDSLLSLYVVVRGPGINIKLPGKVTPDPVTGRLVASFEDNPPLPFESFELQFKGGPRAPLVTPPTCGTHTVTTSLTPNSAFPESPAPRVADPDLVRSPSASFQVTSGPNGAPCPNPGQFDPGFEAGTITPISGTYSPLVVQASRPDGSQPLTGLELDLPEGLTGKLAGIPYCPDAALAAAAGKSGRAELASPSCPAASRVGSVSVAAGAGTTPYQVSGSAYLAGPYKGAPLSVVTITPALAGPFDLGTVVVRAKADVDPATTKVHLTSDPIPTSLRGIPLKVRRVSVSADRPEFTLNPTDCDPATFGANLFGISALQPVSSRFQVGACQALGFKPQLTLRLRGQTKRSGNPALRAVLKQGRGQANIDRAVVVLPATQFIDNAHINNPCTRDQFAADACPRSSVLGHARAFSPLLDQPLEGPVYFRSNGGVRELPDLVADLDGQIRVTLVGFIDSVQVEGGDSARVRTRFMSVPDAPVSRFVMNLFGGKRGLIENSTDICQRLGRAGVRLDGQNGKVADSDLRIGTSCGKGG
jgi:hypothetical protein